MLAYAMEESDRYYGKVTTLRYWGCTHYASTSPSSILNDIYDSMAWTLYNSYNHLF